MDAFGTAAVAATAVSAVANTGTILNATYLNSFGVSLFEELLASSNPLSEGTFIAPFSIAMALALILNGAALGSFSFWEVLWAVFGGVAEADEVLGINSTALPPDIPGGEQLLLVTVDQALQSLMLATQQGANANVTLVNENAAWVKLPYLLSPLYKTRLQTFFGAKAFQLNSAQEVNMWVRQATNGVIPSVTDDKAIKHTLAFLVNAVYFKGAWAEPFKSSNTVKGSFSLAGDPERNVSVAMMYQHYPDIDYISAPDYTAVRLPFAGTQPSSGAPYYAAVIMVPSAGRDPAAVAGQLSGAPLPWGPAPSGVDLYLPRFQVASSLQLKPYLEALGVEAVFNASTAELDDMVTAPAAPGLLPLYITDVVHQVSVSINEQGAQAGAATGAGTLCSRQLTQVLSSTLVRVDMPFLFAVEHIPTGAILFMGTVQVPELWNAGQDANSSLPHPRMVLGDTYYIDGPCYDANGNLVADN